MKLIEQMAETARYVEGLEAKAKSLEATCEDLSRVVACFVRVHGGLISADTWDRVHRRKGFVSCGKRVCAEGVRTPVNQCIPNSRESIMKFELADVEGVIENEIKQGCTQKQIAQSYALALRSSCPTDWPKVNKMIIERWSVSGLSRIKRMAWSGACFTA